MSEVHELREALFECYRLSGADVSGIDGPNHKVWTPQEAVNAVLELRENHDEEVALGDSDCVRLLADRAWEAVAALGECDVKFKAPYINLQRALSELRLEHSDPDWEWTWPKEYETGYDIRREEA